ncbi:RNA lariat debranching enzyme, putative [Candida dubliniensis CD36]|uniref:RNA lariat debranching enzyme, putative n=1 Tax=Candida dubliniensis (strain CD36 / ATCC MYA-646 / CBS 7987 / NCPF 3949 / NRRL Y-17841) TaxID=573826 RepID=B9WIR9_CANDC|nr:RNA lariat debranching enzyme, putative [Candida dubliniensis CD36]CAX41137.1 RNA lariat debranching enzyme, putative [Candida dubliniensis CD36]
MKNIIYKYSFVVTTMLNTLKIAIEGCCHGELNTIYNSIPDIKSLDLLLICGDFQSLRNKCDLQSLNVPFKYQRMADFHEYYSGKRKAPVLTIFIGGNHECSSYLQELKYGGWVAPNIYYLGEFGSIWYKGLQITGWSGIFNYHTFIANHIDMEKLPFDSTTIRSVYHQKLSNFLKMYMMNHDMDIVLSHDWPVGIEKYGNLKRLLKLKPFFKDDIQRGQLGSPLNKFLIHYLRPRYWFSGHLHVKFEARIVDSVGGNDEKISDPTANSITESNKEEISLDMDDEEEEEKDDDNGVGFEEKFYFKQHLNSTKRPRNDLTPQRDVCEHATEFLALDKCGKRRQFLEIKTVEVNNTSHPSFINPGKLYYSKRSIAINKVVEKYLNDNRQDFTDLNTKQILNNPQLFPLVNELMPIIENEFKSMQKNITDEDFFMVPENFQIVAPTNDECIESKLKYYPNNQTLEYCEKFGIPKPVLCEKSDQ